MIFTLTAQKGNGSNGLIFGPDFYQVGENFDGLGYVARVDDLILRGGEVGHQNWLETYGYILGAHLVSRRLRCHIGHNKKNSLERGW